MNRIIKVYFVKYNESLHKFVCNQDCNTMIEFKTSNKKLWKALNQAATKGYRHFRITEGTEKIKLLAIDRLQKGEGTVSNGLE